MTHVRSTALGGFALTQAGPQENPTCWGHARRCGDICCSLDCPRSSASLFCRGCTHGSEVHGPGRFWASPGTTSATPTCWGCPGASGDPLLGPSSGLEVRGPGRFRTPPGKTSACPTCWGSTCGLGKKWTSASPWLGRPRDSSASGLLELLAGLR